MTLLRAFGAVALSTFFCGAVGLGLGVGTGMFAPDFYRVFQYPGSVLALDPVQVGAGFGLNAGIFTGITVGIILVLIVTIYELLKGKQSEESAKSQME